MFSIWVNFLISWGIWENLGNTEDVSCTIPQEIRKFPKFCWFLHSWFRSGFSVARSRILPSFRLWPKGGEATASAASTSGHRSGQLCRRLGCRRTSVTERRFFDGDGRKSPVLTSGAGRSMSPESLAGPPLYRLSLASSSTCQAHSTFN